MNRSKLIMLCRLTCLFFFICQPVSAEFIHIEGEKVTIPSFEIVGTTPITQVGTGQAKPITGKGVSQYHVTLSKIIPSDWDYFVSAKVHQCATVPWTANRKPWVHVLKEVAETSNTRILIDWNFKSILVLAKNELGAESVFFNPREGQDNAIKIDMPADSSLQTIAIADGQQGNTDCVPRRTSICPDMEKP